MNTVYSPDIANAINMWLENLYRSGKPKVSDLNVRLGSGPWAIPYNPLTGAIVDIAEERKPAPYWSNEASNGGLINGGITYYPGALDAINKRLENLYRSGDRNVSDFNVRLGSGPWAPAYNPLARAKADIAEAREPAPYWSDKASNARLNTGGVSLYPGADMARMNAVDPSGSWMKFLLHYPEMRKYSALYPKHDSLVNPYWYMYPSNL